MYIKRLTKKRKEQKNHSWDPHPSSSLFLIGHQALCITHKLRGVHFSPLLACHFPSSLESWFLPSTKYGNMILIAHKDCQHDSHCLSRMATWFSSPSKLHLCSSSPTNHSSSSFKLSPLSSFFIARQAPSFFSLHVSSPWNLSSLFICHHPWSSLFICHRPWSLLIAMTTSHHVLNWISFEIFFVSLQLKFHWDFTKKTRKMLFSRKSLSQMLSPEWLTYHHHVFDRMNRFVRQKNKSFKTIMKNLCKRIYLNRYENGKTTDSGGIYKKIWGREERRNIFGHKILWT